MIVIRRVVGKSMEPTLRNGQLVVAVITREFKAGDVVVAFIDGREVIKRVANVDRQHGQLDLVSDNPDGSNYRGVADRRVESKVVFPFVNKRPK